MTDELTQQLAVAIELLSKHGLLTMEERMNCAVRLINKHYDERISDGQKSQSD